MRSSASWKTYVLTGEVIGTRQHVSIFSGQPHVTTNEKLNRLLSRLKPS
jgi:hypothetical protein